LDETITAIYFCITTVVIAFAIFKAGVNDWIALAVFAFFTIGAISRSANLVKAYYSIKTNPTPEQCMEIAEETYKLNYAAYYEARQNYTYENMLPTRPRHFKVLQWFSIIIASIASLLGLLYIKGAITIFVQSNNVMTWGAAGMFLLYGSLAACFGVKDFFTILQSFRNKSKSIQTNEN